VKTQGAVGGRTGWPLQADPDREKPGARKDAGLFVRASRRAAGPTSVERSMPALVAMWRNPDLRAENATGSSRPEEPKSRHRRNHAKPDRLANARGSVDNLEHILFNLGHTRLL
jgi:hypothetical protein